MQKDVTCSISQLARWGLTRLKEKRQYKTPQDREIARALGTTREFTDAYLESDHPYVDQRLLDRLCDIDPRLELHWELQHYFEHRWHVKYRDTDHSGTQVLNSIIILQYPFAVQIRHQAKFLAFNNEALDHVRRLMHQMRHGLQAEVTERVANHAKEREERINKERLDRADVLDREQRLIQERIVGKRNISDKGWERGVGITESGKPFAEGTGAQSRNYTKAF